MIQESLTNTAKHAAGASAVVRLAFGPAVLALTVEDDGPFATGDAEGTEGHGIIGMRERAATVGGWLTAGPRGGGGFRVLLSGLLGLSLAWRGVVTAVLAAPASAGATP